MRTSIGEITLQPVDVERDVELLHAWVTHPRSEFWMMQGASVDDVRTEYAGIVANPHQQAWLGTVDGRPTFLAETYEPAHSPLADLPELRAGDVGMHVLVAPPDGAPVRGLTTAVFGAVMAFCLDDPRHDRVVVEPDTRNDAIRALNRAAGFVELRDVILPEKTATLSVATRDDFAASRVAQSLDPTRGTVTHLTPGAMDRAQRHLVAKAIGELAHERLLVPTPVEGGYEITADDLTVWFEATRHELEHWSVDASSIAVTRVGEPVDPDVQHLIGALAPTLGVPDDLLPFYLEELAATLASSAWKQQHQRHGVDDLLLADLPTIEAAMTEGHPAFIANNGRIGYSARDHAAYAPESGSDVHLVWLGVRRSLSHLSLGRDLDEKALYAHELDDDVCDRFRGVLTAQGLDADDYLLIPVHPWQWEHKIAITFAPDVARRDLVVLGTSPDRYRAQQSVRTFLNVDRPHRHYVKTALSVQNMGFLRGLSPRYMRATPAINDWVHDLVSSDAELQTRGFSVLRERAAVGYTGDAYHRLAPSTGASAHQKMLAALWRETPHDRVGPGEQVATMASLLHRDHEGRSLAGAMVRASGREPIAWLRSYLDAYLRPVVHCLVAHELAFMPHGENLILVIEDHVVTRVLMKDVGEEVAVLDDQPLPADVERIRAAVPDHEKSLVVLTDVVDGFLRFLAAALVDDGVMGADDFWSTAAACVLDHRADHPELADAHARIDVLAPTFAHSCLNRLQLRNTRQMVDLTDQSSSLMFAGDLDNPMAERGR